MDISWLAKGTRGAASTCPNGLCGRFKITIDQAGNPHSDTRMSKGFLKQIFNKILERVEMDQEGPFFSEKITYRRKHVRKT
jgi:hypothetical protein